ncbi:MAG: hypothetical protein P3M74_00160 [Candidatus Hodgkinia cicadicola]|nr:MAG: hypothetical protein P3M74_00160 [Candidatus Hodgkinia cicadicola]
MELANSRQPHTFKQKCACNQSQNFPDVAAQHPGSNVVIYVRTKAKQLVTQHPRPHRETHQAAAAQTQKQSPSKKKKLNKNFVGMQKNNASIESPALEHSKVSQNQLVFEAQASS